MAKATTKPVNAKATTKVVTEQDLIDNPALEESGVQVGDEIEIPVGKKHYEEWKCEIKAIVEEGKVTGKNVEKLKLMRACVKITDEEAEVLNAGVKDGSNSIVSMYFKSK